ncbi:phage major capsid protein [Chitinimonas lacunae]|uniref:Phage major capsid protein n=1 Tax=Chitinimonas lacunae TaxID=1963018 RepID=A0ABV8MX63_9NEIS
MSQILELKNRRAAIAARADELSKLEAGGTELTAEQLDEVAALQKEFNELGAKLTRLEATQRMVAETAQQVESLTSPQPPPSSSKVPAQARSDVEFRPNALGRLIGAIGDLRGMHPLAAAPYAAERYGEDIGAVLANNQATGGAVLIPQNLNSEIIELMTPRAVVRQMGARAVPLPNGNMGFGRNKGGIVGGYVTQVGDPVTDRIKVGGQKYDGVKMNSKTFAGLVPIHNDLLRNSISAFSQAQIQDDMSIGLATQEDQQFIRGSEDGGKAPKSLLGWTVPAHRLVQTPLPADRIGIIEAVKADTSRMMLCLLGNNSAMRKPGWLMSPRTYLFLLDLVDGNGNKVYPEIANSMFRGYPIGATNNVPSNLGASGKETELYFVDFGDCMIGEDGPMEFAVSTETTYYNADGVLVSAFQNNETLIRVIFRHDFAPRHVENIVVLEKLTWGA